MIKSLMLVASVTSLHAVEPLAADTWTPLPDEKLSQWEIYPGVPDPSLEIPGYTHAPDRDLWEKYSGERAELTDSK